MTGLVVGCPVRNRAWILPTWFEAVGEACDEARMKPEFVFTVSREDQDTLDAISDGAAGLHCIAETIFTGEPLEDDRRVWNMARFKHMCTLRNKNLERVRQIASQYYWSLDSDMVPTTDTLTEALKHFDRFDVVGSRGYMSPIGRDYPSYSMLRQNDLVSRIDQPDSVFPVHCVMAAKLMNPLAYSVDYVPHIAGDDVGYSIAAAVAGVRMGWAGPSRVKHVMDPLHLDRIDERVGF